MKSSKIKIKGKKRAISELIAYVILISLAVSLSSIVYLWLKFYVQSGNVQTCPEGVSVIIKDYHCNNTINIYGTPFSLDLVLQNKGLFTINGTYVFIDNSSSTYSDNTLPTKKIEVPFDVGLNPSETVNFSINYTGSRYISKIAVLPFRTEKGKRVFCDKATIMQKTSLQSKCPA